MDARGRTLGFFLLTLGLVGCSADAPAKQAAEREAPVVPAADPAPEAPAGVPKIAAASAIHDFGAVKAKDSVEHVFTITNQGTADLHIKGVKKT